MREWYNRAHYPVRTLNNYEFTLQDWKIGGAVEDDRQAIIALQPAIHSQGPQKRVNLEFSNIEF